MFSSHDLLRVFLLYRPVVEFKSVDRRFHVRPLLSALTREQRFHLLGLSVQEFVSSIALSTVRSKKQCLSLCRGTWGSGCTFDNRTTCSKNRSPAGPGVGSMKGISFETNTDHERKGEYVSHYFKEGDEGVNTTLRNDTAKLVLAGVEKEVAI
jgi:hypothetical protein